MTRAADPKYCFGMAFLAAPMRAESRTSDRNKMKVIGLVGWSGAGKTTLLSRIIPYLRQQGLRVSVVKHAHHDFDVDVPGKDSWVHRQSGAEEVLVTSANRWALMHELRGDPEPRLTDLLRKMSPVDLVIVEGFKSEPYPKIEVHRQAAGKALLFPDDPAIAAIVTDAAIETTLPLAHLYDIPSIAELMRAHAVAMEDMLAASAAHR
jgi:molybdopterin-guanine dinucleotide biosynthesis adapter protein